MPLFVTVYYHYVTTNRVYLNCIPGTINCQSLNDLFRQVSRHIAQIGNPLLLQCLALLYGGLTALKRIYFCCPLTRPAYNRTKGSPILSDRSESLLFLSSQIPIMPSIATVITMLTRMEMLLAALARPSSPPHSDTNPGQFTVVGAKLTSTNAWRITRSKGR